MGKVRLKVLTVPALDPVTYQDHTAFCVSAEEGGHFQHAPGWTIILERPFFPQRVLCDEEFRP